MADGINRLTGFSVGGGYGLPQRTNTKKNDETEQPVLAQPNTQVDPNRVMDLLANNNVFVKPATTTVVKDLDPETKSRVVDSMARFEMVYGLIQKEFGEDLAPEITTLVMDRMEDDMFS